MILRRRRDAHERQSQDGKHHRLHHSHYDFQKNEGERKGESEQRHHGRKQHFAGEDIAEKTKAERGDLGHFPDNLNQAHEGLDGIDHEHHRIPSHLLGDRKE